MSCVWEEKVTGSIHGCREFINFVFWAGFAFGHYQPPIQIVSKLAWRLGNVEPRVLYCRQPIKPSHRATKYIILEASGFRRDISQVRTHTGTAY